MPIIKESEPIGRLSRSLPRPKGNRFLAPSESRARRPPEARENWLGVTITKSINIFQPNKARRLAGWLAQCSPSAMARVASSSRRRSWRKARATGARPEVRLSSRAAALIGQQLAQNKRRQLACLFFCFSFFATAEGRRQTSFGGGGGGGGGGTRERLARKREQSAKKKEKKRPRLSFKMPLIWARRQSAGHIFGLMWLWQIIMIIIICCSSERKREASERARAAGLCLSVRAGAIEFNWISMPLDILRVFRQRRQTDGRTKTDAQRVDWAEMVALRGGGQNNAPTLGSNDFRRSAWLAVRKTPAHAPLSSAESSERNSAGQLVAHDKGKEMEKFSLVFIFICSLSLSLSLALSLSRSPSLAWVSGPAAQSKAWPHFASNVSHRRKS